MYLTKRRYRRTKKRVYKHKKTQKRQQIGGGFIPLYPDIPLSDFIQTGYLEAKYALEKYPPDRWPNPFKIKQNDIDFQERFSGEKDPVSLKLQNIFKHNIPTIKQSYKNYYDSQKSKPRVSLMDYAKPMSFEVKQMLKSVEYIPKGTAEILSPKDFDEVIDYVSSSDIHSKKFGVNTATNNKYLLFGPSLDLFVKSQSELKTMTSASEAEVDKKDLILGIVSQIKSMKSAAIKSAEESGKNMNFFLKAGAIALAKQAAEAIYQEVKSEYENYKARLKKIRDLAMYINRERDAKLLEILLTVPKAAFEVDKPQPGNPPVYAPGGKPAVTAAKPAVTAAKPAAKPAVTAAKPAAKPAVTAAKPAVKPAVKPAAKPAVKPAPPAQLVVTGTSIKPSVKSI